MAFLFLSNRQTELAVSALKLNRGILNDQIDDMDPTTRKCKDALRKDAQMMMTIEALEEAQRESDAAKNAAKAEEAETITN